MTRMIPIIEIGGKKIVFLFLPVCLFLTFDSSLCVLVGGFLMIKVKEFFKREKL